MKIVTNKGTIYSDMNAAIEWEMCITHKLSAYHHGKCIRDDGEVYRLCPMDIITKTQDCNGKMVNRCCYELYDTTYFSKDEVERYIKETCELLGWTFEP